MKLVRKVSRKRYFNKRLYEYERLMVPLPSESIDVVKHWLGRDLKVFVEPLAEGFAVLVIEGDARIGGPLSLKFRKAMKELAPRKPTPPISG